MPIKPPANIEARIGAAIDKHAKRVLKAIVYRLAYIGNEAVNIARQNHKYLDQTGNLTSSIGYVIAINGEVVSAGDFNVVKNGTEGAQTGESYARRIAASYPHNITLIVVAGMNYAAYVEERGLGGMTAGELLAKVEVESLISEFQKL